MIVGAICVCVLEVTLFAVVVVWLSIDGLCFGIFPRLIMGTNYLAGGILGISKEKVQWSRQPYVLDNQEKTSL